MTPEQAAALVIGILTDTKKEIIKNGIATPEYLFVTCKRLGSLLNLEAEYVAELMMKIEA